MKVLLTGASGFFGSHVASALLGNGHEIYAFHRENTDFWRLEAETSRMHWFDLSRHDLQAPFEAAGHVGAVIHCAACYGRAGESASQVEKANTLFPLELVEIASSFKCPLFLNMDTYFHKERPGFNYVTNYSMSKKHFVDWAKCLAARIGIRVVNLKLEHLYGPKDHTAKFTTFIAEACLRNEPLVRLTLGEQKRDFIFVDDAVSALPIFLERSQFSPGFESHEIGTGIAISVKEFVEYLRDAAGSTTQLHFGALPYREGEIMNSVADNTSLLKLGWKVQIDWRQGIGLLLESISGMKPLIKFG